MKNPRLIALIDDLRQASGESPCVEFKENYSDPKKIGVYVSALANSAVLADKPFGYVIWGVRDHDRAVVGTRFKSETARVGNQPLELWLTQHLTPNAAISFETVDHPDGRIVILQVPAASASPVEFDRAAYFRIGSATPRLADHPERQRALWEKLRPYLWESGVAAQFLTGDEILDSIDYTNYFDLTRQRLPDNRKGIFDRLEQDNLISMDVGGRWNITNLGAILFAKCLEKFDTMLAARSLRFTAYNGSDRHAMVTHRKDWKRGYAVGFSEFLSYIDGLLPANEYIVQAFRVERKLFPEVAIRELIANALIHQDMTLVGAGPTIELFCDRIEITNPGTPLIEPNRLIDAVPRTRNVALAALMRRMHLCEELGTGIDKVISEVELYQLPPPDFRVYQQPRGTRAVLFAPRGFSAMNVDERVRACYQHTVLRYLAGGHMRNASLRERFGVDAKSRAQISKVISATVERNLIRPADQTHPQSGYIPSWA